LSDKELKEWEDEMDRYVEIMKSDSFRDRLKQAEEVASDAKFALPGAILAASVFVGFVSAMAGSMAWYGVAYHGGEGAIAAGTAAASSTFTAVTAGTIGVAVTGGCVAWCAIVWRRRTARKSGNYWYGWNIKQLEGYPKTMLYENVDEASPFYITAKIKNNGVNFDQPGAAIANVEIPPETVVQVLSWKQKFTQKRAWAIGWCGGICSTKKTTVVWNNQYTVTYKNKKYENCEALHRDPDDKNTWQFSASDGETVSATLDDQNSFGKQVQHGSVRDHSNEHHEKREALGNVKSKNLDFLTEYNKNSIKDVNEKYDAAINTIGSDNEKINNTIRNAFKDLVPKYGELFNHAAGKCQTMARYRWKKTLRKIVGKCKYCPKEGKSKWHGNDASLAVQQGKVWDGENWVDAPPPKLKAGKRVRAKKGGVITVWRTGTLVREKGTSGNWHVKFQDGYQELVKGKNMYRVP